MCRRDQRDRAACKACASAEKKNERNEGNIAGGRNEKKKSRILSRTGLYIQSTLAFIDTHARTTCRERRNATSRTASSCCAQAGKIFLLRPFCAYGSAGCSNLFATRIQVRVQQETRAGRNKKKKGQKTFCHPANGCWEQEKVDFHAFLPPPSILPLAGEEKKMKGGR